ncbi:MAG: sugar kinase [Anaerolineae bacterium]|nr:sugar kinase [Anaerolineae bacterium]
MNQVITFGEVMMRLTPPGFQRIFQANVFEVKYAGAEANVAASLARYGIPNQFVTCLPVGDIGDACIGYLRQHGIGTDYIVRGGGRLGIYFLETGAVHRASKVIYDRDNSAIAQIKPGMIDWRTMFANADWFHWTGITPALSEGAAQVCLEAAQTARQMGLTVSCDLNYRAKLWKWGKKPAEVMPDLVSQCDVVIGNEEDADQVFGIKAPDADVIGGKVEAESYVYVLDEMMNRFPNIQMIATTLRGSLSASHNTWSAVLMSRAAGGGSKAVYTAPTYQITPIVDRVGGGDSFMGGLIYGRKAYQDIQTALNFATAASCLKHTILGDFNMVTVAEVEKLMSGDASGRVSR